MNRFNAVLKIAYAIVIVCSIILLSCIDVPPNSKESYKFPKRAYIRKVCTSCNGVGKVKATTSDRVALGVFTLGLGALVDDKQCEICKGKGTVDVPVIKDSLIFK